MKSVTVREFYRNLKLVDGLAQGEELVVTSNGKPKFVVSKSARSRMTRKLAAARATGGPKQPVFDGTAFLISLKI